MYNNTSDGLAVQFSQGEPNHVTDAAPIKSGDLIANFIQEQLNHLSDSVHDKCAESIVQINFHHHSLTDKVESSESVVQCMHNEMSHSCNHALVDFGKSVEQCLQDELNHSCDDALIRSGKSVVQKKQNELSPFVVKSVVSYTLEEPNHLLDDAPVKSKSIVHYTQDKLRKPLDDQQCRCETNQFTRTLMSLLSLVNLRLSRVSKTNQFIHVMVL